MEGTSGRMPEKADPVRVIGYRPQRTLAATAELEGVGFITGARVRVRFRPSPIDTGRVFRRTDQALAAAIPARADCVSGTDRRTTLGPPASGVTLVEHLLAALAGLRIDNCLIELDGPEPPGLDGSADGFVTALAAAGTVNQAALRPIYTPTAPVVVSRDGATIGLHPATDTDLRASYLLDYGVFARIPRQTYTLEVRPGEFAREVAPCRTFVTAAEADALRAQGIGKHLTPADLVVFGDRGPIHNRLRFADEPARHKVLDMIGDLALCGFDLAGHLVAYRSGHALNVELARQLAAAAAESSSHPAASSRSSAWRTPASAA
jgi:UDP-3-O-[3-hydroxymyristoyl] N-acetylglucosamine deacetylase